MNKLLTLTDLVGEVTVRYSSPFGKSGVWVRASSLLPNSQATDRETGKAPGKDLQDATRGVIEKLVEAYPYTGQPILPPPPEKPADLEALKKQIGVLPAKSPQT